MARKKSEKIDKRGADEKRRRPISKAAALESSPPLPTFFQLPTLEELESKAKKAKK